jgi:hypothetical protein
MDSLSLQWIAKFKDDTIIHQFDDKGNETKFEEVKKRFNDLILFSLHHKELPFKIVVDLKLGLIHVNNILTPEPDILISKKNIRLIYFRRNRVQLNDKFKEIRKEIYYMLGYQYNDEQGNNYKVITQIDSNGNMVLG